MNSTPTNPLNTNTVSQPTSIILNFKFTVSISLQFSERLFQISQTITTKSPSVLAVSLAVEKLQDWYHHKSVHLVHTMNYWASSFVIFTQLLHIPHTSTCTTHRIIISTQTHISTQTQLTSSMIVHPVNPGHACRHRRTSVTTSCWPYRIPTAWTRSAVANWFHLKPSFLKPTFSPWCTSTPPAHVIS